MILLLLALSGALLGWMFFGLDPEFQRLSGAGGFLDTRLAGYDTDAVLALQAALADPARADARDLLQLMYLGPDMVLPFALTLSLCLMFRGHAAGAVLYGRRLDVRNARLLCLLPIAYGLVDYAENASFLLYFPPAAPGPTLSALIPVLLPWMSSVKLMVLAISVLLVLRLALFKPPVTRG